MPRHSNTSKKSDIKPNNDKMKELLNTEEDFIASKRFNYSLKEFCERYPNGAPDKTITSGLMLNEQEVKEMYNNIVLKIRALLKINL